MFKLEDGTKILDADHFVLPTGEFDRIQFVAVRFVRDRAPESWKEFEEEDGNWAALSPETGRKMTEELETAIVGGKVRDITLNFDPWGEDYFLSAEFGSGWAAILYNAIDRCVAAPCDPDCPDGLEDAPVDIGGQTPVPKMCGVEGLERAAQIVLYMLETGRLSPETKWAVNLEGDLPWLFW